MNFFSNLLGGITNTAKKVGSYVGSLFNQGNANLAGLGASTYLGGAKTYASPTQQTIQNTSTPTGPNISYTPYTNTGAGVPKTTTPTGTITSQGVKTQKILQLLLLVP